MYAHSKICISYRIYEIDYCSLFISFHDTKESVSKITLEIPHFSELLMHKYVIRYHIHTYGMLRITYSFVCAKEKGDVYIFNLSLLFP